MQRYADDKQMPFADDVRRYTFPSLDRLINKKGQVVTSHPYLPTTEQIAAMENFVDGMDLMHAGDEDEEGFAYLIYPRLACFDDAFAGSAAPGTTRDTHITPPSTARNKHSSMQLWSRI